MKLRTKKEELIKNNPIQIVRNTTKHDAKWEEHFQKYSDLINQYGGPDKIPHSITIDEHFCVRGLYCNGKDILIRCRL